MHEVVRKHCMDYLVCDVVVFWGSSECTKPDRVLIKFMLSV